MSVKRFNAKRDTSEAAIVEGLRSIGAQVLRLEAIDLLVLYKGHLFLFEVKTPGSLKRRTKRQRQLVAAGWPVHFVTSLPEALKILTEIDVEKMWRESNERNFPVATTIMKGLG